MGAGAIGLTIAKFSFLRGASKVYIVDKDAHRLEIASSLGAISINIEEHKDVTDRILELEPHGVDCGIEASGFRSAQSWQHTFYRAVGKFHRSAKRE